jgi:hypothetical protein
MRRILSLATFSLLALSSTAIAQRGGAVVEPSPELGVDAALTFDLSGNPKTTTLALPVQGIRAGFFLSPTMSLEPSFHLNTVSGGGTSATEYGVGVAMLWHLSPSRTANQWYLRPFIDFSGFSFSGSPSQSAVTFGGGVGIKMPIGTGNRFATRFEGAFGHTGSHNGTPASDALALLAGLSVYTH